MSRILSRQALGVVLVALLVVTAGCSGLTGGNQADANEEDEEEEAEDDSSDESDAGSDETATEGSTSTDAGGGMTVTEPAGTINQNSALGSYDFSQGESYSYTISGSSGEYVWTVTEASGDQITAEVTVDFGGQGQTETYTGTTAEVFDQVAQGSGSGSIFLAMRSINLVVQDRTLAVGNTWTIDADNLESGGGTPTWERATAEVTGTESYGGIQCSVVEITPDNGEPFTFCTNQDVPFALSLTTQSQGQEFTLELTEATR